VTGAGDEDLRFRRRWDSRGVEGQRRRQGFGEMRVFGVVCWVFAAYTLALLPSWLGRGYLVECCLMLFELVIAERVVFAE